MPRILSVTSEDSSPSAFESGKQASGFFEDIDTLRYNDDKALK
jgi:hypothetical protein